MTFVGASIHRKKPYISIKTNQKTNLNPAENINIILKTVVRKINNYIFQTCRYQRQPIVTTIIIF